MRLVCTGVFPWHPTLHDKIVFFLVWEAGDTFMGEFMFFFQADWQRTESSSCVCSFNICLQLTIILMLEQHILGVAYSELLHCSEILQEKEINLLE